MYADAVLVMVLQIESNPHGLQSESHDLHHGHMTYYKSHMILCNMPNLTTCHMTYQHNHMINILGHMISVAVKEESGRRKRESSFPDRLLKLMREMFGVENVNWSREEEEKIEIIVDSNLAVLNTSTLVRNGESGCII